MRLLFSLVVFLAVASVACAAEVPCNLSEILRSIRERHGVPALGGAIVSGSSLAAIGVDGVRERRSTEKATIEDKWHLGSCTKAMTATLIAELVEEGKLSFETTCSQGFPGTKMDAGWRGVQLWLFLHHRSGATYNIPEQLTAAHFGVKSPTPREERRRLTECLLSRPPETKPGTTSTYSNIGFYAAAAMAEQATNTSLEDLMHERLFKPLGMSSAGFGPPGSVEKLDQPRGHNAQGKSFPPGPDADYSTAGWPAGGVHASIGDWAKFASLHLCGERKDGARLVKPEMFAKLHEPMGDDPRFAAGWVVLDRDWAGGRVLTHSGSNERWYCTVSLAPERNFAVLAVCNQGGDAGAKAVNDAINALIQDHLARTAPPPSSAMPEAPAAK